LRVTINEQQSAAETVHQVAERRILVFAVGYLLSAALCCLLAVRGQAQFVDTQVYRLGGDAVLAGTNLYGPRFAGLPFTYPPFAAVVCVLFAVLPWSGAVALVTCSSVGLLVLALYWALRLPPLAGRLDSRTAWMVAFGAGAAAIWLEPVRTAIGYGQIDLLIVAGVLYDLSLPDSARHKGAVIGLVAGLKLTPAIFVPYLLLTRRYRAAATATAAFAGTVAIGWIAQPGSSLHYWNVTFLNPGHVGLVQDAGNQSLLGVLARNLHTPHVTWLWLPLAIIVAVTGMALAVVAGRRDEEGLGFGLCAITGLLISPISWTHHWVIAVPAGLLIAVNVYLGAGRRPRWMTFTGGMALAVVAGLGWARLARNQPSSHWLHLPAVGLLDSEIYVVAGLVTLAAGAYALVVRNVRPSWEDDIRPEIAIQH
jgi:alpha-1,2-mannosyltransferase